MIDLSIYLIIIFQLINLPLADILYTKLPMGGKDRMVGRKPDHDEDDDDDDDDYDDDGNFDDDND